MTAPAPGQPSPPPEAALIRLAREASGMSPEAAAARATVKLGGSRWRHIERGYETKDRPVRAPDKTLAHMARAVDVSPERLDEVGRGTAAAILREILRRESETAPAPEAALTSRELQLLTDIVTSTAEKLDLSPEEVEEAFRRARMKLERNRGARDQSTESPERRPRHRAG